jgi:hypothetical protein
MKTLYTVEHHYSIELTAIKEVERESESSFWVKGKRHAKFTPTLKTFDTFEAAKEYAVEFCARRLANAERELAKCQHNLQAFKNLQGQDFVRFTT